MIVGVCGFIGSGKGEFSKTLVSDYGYQEMSFASTLKDVLAAVFHWDRALLEGTTPESRAWREVTDTWWANRLGIPEFTPRWAMQNIGTGLFRAQFNDSIWVYSLEKAIEHKGDRVCISDCRFANEIKMIQRLGGHLVRIKRGPDPEWYNTALAANTDPAQWIKCDSVSKMKSLGIHESEWKWVGVGEQTIISNDGTLAELKQATNHFLARLPPK